MRERKPIIPERRRHVPPQFSWIDHRLVRDGHIEGHSARALALYLFLVTVADADGLSWYSEASVCRRLSFSEPELHDARAELQNSALVAYRRPLYQVLDLGPKFRPLRSQRSGDEAASVGEILTRILGGSK
jgi:hypothetical protein